MPSANIGTYLLQPDTRLPPLQQARRLAYKNQEKHQCHSASHFLNLNLVRDTYQISAQHPCVLGGIEQKSSIFPEKYSIQFKTLVLEDVVSQITEAPGYLKFGYGSWALPQSGLAWLLTQTTPPPTSNLAASQQSAAQP